MPRNFVDKSAWNTATTKVNATAVPIAGETNSIFQNLGLPCPPLYGSQDDVGKRFLLTENDMVPLASSQYLLSTGAALYGCIIQLVPVDSGATAANIAPGLGAYLLNTATGGAAGSGAQQYTVTSADQAISTQHLCGVFTYASPVSDFTWIIVHGKCPVQYIATVTATTAGGTIIVSGTAGKFDVPTQSGNPTFAQMGTILGNAISTPANGALGTAIMRNLQGRY